MEQASRARTELERRALRMLDTDVAELDDETYGRIRQAQAEGHPVFERLRRVCRLSAGARYAGPEAEQLFMDEDATAAEGGQDMVSTLEAQQAQGHAARAANAQARRLDAAIEKGTTPAERRRLLSAAISERTKQLDTQLGVSAPSGSDGRTAREGKVRALSAVDDVDQIIRASRKMRGA